MRQLRHFGIGIDTYSNDLVRGTCEVCKSITDVSTQYSNLKERNIKICDDCLDKHNKILSKQGGWGTPKGLI